MNRMRERETTLKAERKPPGLSIQAFRAFYLEGRMRSAGS
jgi:hypothetical protein